MPAAKTVRFLRNSVSSETTDVFKKKKNTAQWVRRTRKSERRRSAARCILYSAAKRTSEKKKWRARNRCTYVHQHNELRYGGKQLCAAPQTVARVMCCARTPYSYADAHAATMFFSAGRERFPRRSPCPLPRVFIIFLNRSLPSADK